jgi:hypothetical protein
MRWLEDLLSIPLPGIPVRSRQLSGAASGYPEAGDADALGSGMSSPNRGIATPTVIKARMRLASVIYVLFTTPHPTTTISHKIVLTGI